MSDGAGGTVLLLRHPPVAKAWAGRCYGQSDMGWSRAGAALATTLAERLGGQGVDAIVHSGVRRTARLAMMIAAPTGCVPTADPRWAERDFGSWEGRRWDAIWRETGDLMDGMMTDPTGFRPGGGETTDAVARRARAAWADLPRGGTTLVIAHGGPIAAIRAWLADAPPERIADFIPACGEAIALSRRDRTDGRSRA